MFDHQPLGRAQRLACAMALLGLGTTACLAQVGVGLRTDRKRYLRYEPIMATVMLRNDTGNTLVFDQSSRAQNTLRFVIEMPEDRRARVIDADTNPVDGLILGAGEVKELTLTLNALYEMQAEGAYTISAKISHQRLAHDFASAPVMVEVREGTVAWTRLFGVPAATPTAPIPMRTVSLLALAQEDGGIYALRIEDDHLVYGVTRLGPRIAASPPECEMDAVSNIHVLLQTRPRLYVHRVFDYNMNLKQERHYLPEGSIPRLVRDPDIGRVMVTGGLEGTEGVDFQRADGEGANPAR